MSLVGSLEDLGLGDILQIVSLARKSGRLVLRTDGEAGWIVLCDGQVRGAAIKGQSDDLRGLLVKSGVVSGDVFDRVREQAGERDAAVDEILVAEGLVSQERLDGLRRERVERSVMGMFLWRTGEFSFEVRDQVDPQDLELLLPTGINTQYLAMEASRLQDEGELLGPVPGDEVDDEPLFSGEEPPAEMAMELTADEETPASQEAGQAQEADAVEAMALASARGVEAAEEDPDGDTLSGYDAGECAATVAATVAVEEAGVAAEPVAVSVAEEEPAAVAVPVAEQEPAEPPVAESVPVPEQEAAALVEERPLPEPPVREVSVAELLAKVEDSRTPAQLPPIVAMDPDLRILEWLKAQAVERFPRVHIFQRSDLGMERVRHYLARGVVPLVVASPAMLDEQDAGRRLLARLRTLSPHMGILTLCRKDETQPAGTSGRVGRPSAIGSDPESWQMHEGAARELVDALLAAARPGPRRSGGRTDAALESLRNVSNRLRDPERRDDVLSVVLEFAARTLSRVAVFMLRDDEALGMAESGMPRAGGPDAEQIRSLVLPREGLPALFRQALECRQGVRGPMSPGEDAELVEQLGGLLPGEAYAAPIESGGSPVALVYGDNLPHDAPIGDTTALEIVLHEAGLALDRASLELALAAAQGEA